MKLVWAPQALRDLAAIHQYIAHDDPVAARRVLLHVRDAARRLTEMPEIGRSDRWPGTRELVLTRFPYVLPYRVHGDEIQVIAVMHSSRRWPDDPAG